MNKKNLLWLALILFSMPSLSLFAQFAGGSGTEQDPYQVATAEHLNNVRDYSSAWFIQTADIDLGVAPWNQGEGWVPIELYGVYDGAGHVIDHLYINRPGNGYQALFSNNSWGTIKNLGVTNINVTGGGLYTGGLVAYNDHGTINNCYSKGSVTGGTVFTGGLVGCNESGTINNCYSTGSVTSGGENTGGLVGCNNSGTISNCYNTGSVTGSSRTGGLVGLNYGTINNCYNTGSIVGTLYCNGGLVGANSYGDISNCYNTGSVVGGMGSTGGLVGANSYGDISNCYNNGSVTGEIDTGGLVGGNYGTISNCYSTGSVTGGGYCTGGLVGYGGSGGISNCYSTGSVTGGTYYTGGLVAYNDSETTISNCYSTGSVTGGTYYTGGLVGYNDGGSISNSYWDIVRSGQTISNGGEGRSTIEMVYPHAANTYQGWDWRIWKPDPEYTVNAGYPYIRNPNEISTQAPAPALIIYPPCQAISILPSLTLQWEVGFSPSNVNITSGFKLWLGTDNPPTNIYAGLDMGYQLNYDPNPDLEVNTTYYWKIVPYNTIGEAQNCPVWSFTTYNPNFSLLQPNGGELWQSGTTQTIRWTQNASPQVGLSISFDNGNQWIEIATVENSRNYFHYQVPMLTSNNCLVKLYSLLDGSQYDLSDGSFSISSGSSQPKVILDYPSAVGINLEVGEVVNLTWTRQNVGAVALDISTDDGQNWTEIASGLDATFYLWTVPDLPSSECRVRIRSNANPNVLDISDNAFSIGKIQLISPNGGELFTADYSRTYYYLVTWNALGITLVNIEYSTDGGSTWTWIRQQYNANTGLYYWYPPGTPTSNGLIRISCSGNSAINDVSDSPFNVRNPLKLLNANGGGFITNYSMFNIRWKLQDISPAAQIHWEYSSNNSSWTRINTSAVTAGNESMYWFVNTGLFDNMWLRAVEAYTKKIVGKSEAPFRVTDKALMLYEPNGSEEYIALTTQTISWDHCGLSNLSIYFSADDGETWNQLAANIPASNLSYSWIVPETPSVHCRIKLQDESYSYMNLVSDLPFTILPLQVIAPTVDFTANVLSGDIPLSVQFTEDVNPGVGGIASRLWDFGDGNTTDQFNPLHIYTVPGTYSVSLTITNDFGGSTTKTKTDYVTALPNTPRIELLSASSLNYGVVYLGDTSPAQTIVVKNIGTAPLHITSVSYYLANSQFALSGTVLPVTVPVTETMQLSVVFVPVTIGAVSDSIYIHSDASNLPGLAVKLSAVGEYVPPAAVEGLEVSVIGNDAHLSWLPVTTTIYGTPIDPDGYIVLYNETPYEDEHFYYFHSFVTETNFVHLFVAQYRQQMFYRIVAVKNYREEEIAYLKSLNESKDRLTWGAVIDKLHTLKQRQ